MKSMFTVVKPSSFEPAVAHQRHRLEEHLGQDDRRAQVQVHPSAVEVGHHAREGWRKSRCRPLANRSTGSHWRTHVDDVGADRHVHGRRPVELAMHAARMLRVEGRGGLRPGGVGTHRAPEAVPLLAAPSVMARLTSVRVSSAMPNSPSPEGCVDVLGGGA